MPQGALATISPKAGWTWEPLGYLAPRVSEDGYGELEPLSVYLGAGVVRRADRENNHNVLGADMDKYLRVLPGDLVFNKLRTWQGGLGASKFEGVVSPAYYVLRPGPRLEPRFAHYLLVSTPYLAELTRLSKFMPPSQFDMPWEALKRLPIALPPVEEQRRIADFLDDQVSRVEAVVASRQVQNHVLGEFRQSFITSHVLGYALQGRPDSSPLSQGDRSGADLPSAWMKSIPHHWDWVKLSRVAQLGTGHTPDRNRSDYWVDCTIPWVTAADLSRREDAFAPLMETEQQISELGLAKSAAVLHPTGTIMLCRTASIGLSCRIGRPMATTQAFVTWTPGASLDSTYLHYVIEAMKPEFDRLAYGSTHLTIYMPDLEALRVPLPPLVEQVSIAKAIDQEMESLRLRAEAEGRSIKLLEERKRSLITAAVTGELDVTTARPIGMGKWVPSVGASLEVSAAKQGSSIGGIG